MHCDILPSELKSEERSREAKGLILDRGGEGGVHLLSLHYVFSRQYNCGTDSITAVVRLRFCAYD